MPSPRQTVTSTPTDRAETSHQGRGGTHLVDQAIAWARRLDQGETQAAILRSYPARRRPSRGYISVVARLGHALKDVPPLELAMYRSPRVTLRLAQRVVRREADAAAIRHQLRTAISQVLAPALPRRGARTRDSGGRGARRSGDPDLFAWRWDGAWAERDPAGYAEAYLEFLQRLQREMGRRMRGALARRTAPPITLAGQSMAALTASIAAYRRSRLDGASGPAARALDAEEQRTLTLLRELEQTLGRVLEQGTGRPPPQAAGWVPPRTAGPVPLDEDTAQPLDEPD